MTKRRPANGQFALDLGAAARAYKCARRHARNPFFPARARRYERVREGECGAFFLLRGGRGNGRVRHAVRVSLLWMTGERESRCGGARLGFMHIARERGIEWPAWPQTGFECFGFR